MDKNKIYIDFVFYSVFIFRLDGKSALKIKKVKNFVCK